MDIQNTLFVGENFDKLLKRDMAPEELYAVIVDDVKATYADE